MKKMIVTTFIIVLTCLIVFTLVACVENNPEDDNQWQQQSFLNCCNEEPDDFVSYKTDVFSLKQERMVALTFSDSDSQYYYRCRSYGGELFNEYWREHLEVRALPGETFNWLPYDNWNGISFVSVLVEKGSGQGIYGYAVLNIVEQEGGEYSVNILKSCKISCDTTQGQIVTPGDVNKQIDDAVIGLLGEKNSSLIRNLYFSNGYIDRTLSENFTYTSEKGDVIILSYIGSEKNIKVPNGVSKIASGAFAGLDIEGLELPNGISIGPNAFAGVHNLRSAALPVNALYALGEQPYLERLRIVGNYGKTDISGINFTSYGGLEYVELYIPLEPQMFADCIRLQKVYLYNDCKSIPVQAFEGCVNLIKVSGPSEIDEIGDRAFRNCYSLKNILEGRIIGEAAYENCFALDDFYAYHPIEEIKKDAFKNCTSLRFVSISKGSDMIIRERAFYGCQGMSIEFEEGVRSIGQEAFWGCNLYRLQLPVSLTSIGKNAFEKEELIFGIEYAGTVEQWNAIDKEGFWNSAIPRPKVICSDDYIKSEDPFVYEKKEDGTYAIVGFREEEIRGLLTVPAQSPFYKVPITEIKSDAFSRIYHVDEIVLEEGITTIDGFAFRASYVVQITIPSTVTQLGNGSFFDTYKLIHIINKSALAIDYIDLKTPEEWDATQAKQDFNKWSYKDLVEIVGDESQFVRKLTWNENGICLLHDGEDAWLIGSRSTEKDLDLSQYTFNKMMNYALAYQNKLESIVLPGSADISKSALSWCPSLKKIVLSEGVKVINNSAFYYCSNLTEIVIPDSVTRVERYAFYECDSLKTIYLGNGISYVDSDAIMGPDYLYIKFNGNWVEWHEFLKKNKWVARLVFHYSVTCLK